MKDFYLYENIVSRDLEKQLIFIIENDSRYQRFMKTGKIFYSMQETFPEQWNLLQALIMSLDGDIDGFDYALQLKYTPGVGFVAHYDSKHRWGEFIVGVNLGSEAEIYFTKKDTETVYKTIPARSIYVMSGDCRYKWRHGIRKVKEIRYSITFRQIKLK